MTFAVQELRPIYLTDLTLERYLLSDCIVLHTQKASRPNDTKSINDLPCFAAYRLIADVAFDENNSQTFFSDNRVCTVPAAERAPSTCITPNVTNNSKKYTSIDY